MRLPVLFGGLKPAASAWELQTSREDGRFEIKMECRWVRK